MRFTVCFSILSHNPDYDVPPLVTDLISFMSEHSLNVEGLFRRSAEVSRIKRLQERIDKGLVKRFLLVVSTYIYLWKLI